MTAPVDIGTLIVSTPEVVGGRPRVAGTGVTVDQLASLWKQGLSPERILAAKYTDLTLAQIYAAIAYYHANQAEIDLSIAESAKAYDAWKAEEQVRRMSPGRRSA